MDQHGHFEAHSSIVENMTDQETPYKKASLPHSGIVYAERSLEQSLWQFGTITNPNAFRDYDMKFHLQIAEATQNSMLINLVNMMRKYFRAWIQERLLVSPIDASELTRISLLQHEAILEKIAERDSSGARDAMAIHIETAGKDLRSQIPKGNIQK